MNNNKQSQKGINASQGQFGTEFASETNAAEVRAQNQQSAAKGAQGASAGASAGQFGTEFASETNAAEVRRQNQQSQSNKQ